MNDYSFYIGLTIGLTQKHTGSSFEYQDIDEQDAIYRALVHQATKDNLIVRMWLPTTIGTAEYDTSRINFYLDEAGKITDWNIG